MAKKDLVPMLLMGRGDIIASGLSSNNFSNDRISFSTPYKKVEEVIVKRVGVNLNDVADEMIITPGKSTQVSISEVFLDEINEEGTTNETFNPTKVRWG